MDLSSLGLVSPVRRPDFRDAPCSPIGAVLERGLAENSDADALIGRSGRYSYRALDAEVARAAGALARLGVGPGDRVAASLPNDVDIVVLFLATLRRGAIWVGVNRPLAAAEKAYLLRDSGARVCLADCAGASEIAASRSELPELERLLEVTRDESGTCSATGVESWREAMKKALPTPTVVVDPFEPAVISYTSGTTGHPKGAVLSHHNLLLPGAVVARSGRFERELRHAAVLPLTIANIMVLAPLTAFQCASPCIVVDRLDPEGLAAWIREEAIGHFAGVPTLLYDMLSHPSVRAEDLRSLRCPEVGGADCPDDFRRLYRERFGVEVTIGYGMTEAPSAVTRTAPGDAMAPGLCGRPLPQIAISIRDDDNRPLPRGELGEVCVEAARDGEWAGVYLPMLGYWRRPEATAEALRDGVYRTGDLGWLDESGQLFLRGRRNELILRGGANVYPAEVERVLREHPGVEACAVLGVPDARLGQRVVAAVERAAGGVAEAETLIAHCRGKLARYKIPEAIRFVDALPRNTMGKVTKKALAPLFEEGQPAP